MSRGRPDGSGRSVPMAETYADVRIRVHRRDQEWMIKYQSEAGLAVKW